MISPEKEGLIPYAPQKDCPNCHSDRVEKIANDKGRVDATCLKCGNEWEETK